MAGIESAPLRLVVAVPRLLQDPLIRMKDATDVRAGSSSITGVTHRSTGLDNVGAVERVRVGGSRRITRAGVTMGPAPV